MEEMRRLVFEALGEASMCWSETPKGVFDGAHAKQIGEDLLKAIQESSKDHATKDNGAPAK